MPSKHIDEKTWKMIQDEHVKSVTETGLSIKDTQVLKAVILIGLSTIRKENYIEIFEVKKEQ